MTVDAANISLTDYPIQRSGVIAQHVLDEMVLYDSEKEEGYSLNQSARSIWDLCDGQRTISDICSALAAPLSLDPGLLQDDVLITIQQLAAMNLVTLNEPTASA
ncbi:MAG: PqqD family protein [Rhodothermaceae bacterium]|nr:PqqD family protein [Rhodothermaceae bacterium]